jgi:exopolysaccharide biosynthesis polyprenyl glycosylphosphotransferase
LDVDVLATPATVGVQAPPLVPAQQTLGHPTRPTPQEQELRRPDRLAWRRAIAWSCMAVDFLAISVAVLAVLLVDRPQPQMSPRAIVFALAEVPLWLIALNLCRAHEPRFLAIGSEEFRRVFDAAVRLAAVIAVAAYGVHALLPRSLVVVTIPLAVSLDVAGRYGVRKVVHRLRRHNRCVNRLLLVGAKTSVANLADQFRRSSYVGMSVIGCCVDRRVAGGRLDGQVPVLGSAADAAAVALRYGATAIAVTSEQGLERNFIKSLAWNLEGTDIELMVAPALTDCVGPRIHIRPVAGLPLLHIEKPQLSGGHRLLKALFDHLVASVALVLLLPLLATIALVIRMTSPGPAIFRQRRVGRGGRQFTLFKFRTMVRDAEAVRNQLITLNIHQDGPLFKMQRDPRITRFGAFLRKYSLDELPQLINVVKGDMSLVGPRPPLPIEVASYDGPTERRMLVPPGLTGLWQISGRSDLDWQEAVRLDLHYVENWSLALDALILWKTVPAILRHRGAY